MLLCDHVLGQYGAALTPEYVGSDALHDDRYTEELVNVIQSGVRFSEEHFPNRAAMSLGTTVR